eukprot:Hpha_TRINITY_DN15815_c2_g13::TRINITY_DN15815_c2_g13_i1::g.189655::m.189655/K00726/MGAT1; alpha-1,3-mannosyl-glycoprotein beta-1,2-N-acetylglucosaminyltransferase
MRGSGRGGGGRTPVILIAGLFAWLLFLTVWVTTWTAGPAPGGKRERDAGREEMVRLEKQNVETVKVVLGELRELKDAVGVLQSKGGGAAAGDDDFTDAAKQEIHRLEKELEDCHRKSRQVLPPPEDDHPRSRHPPPGTPQRHPPPREDSSRRNKWEDPPPPRHRSHDRDRDQDQDRERERPRETHRRSKGEKGRALAAGVEQRGIKDSGWEEVLEKEDGGGGATAVLIFSYSRAGDLRRCVERVLEVLARDTGFRVFVSQDGTAHPQVTETAESFRSQGVVHLVHKRNDSGATRRERQLRFEPYYAIAHHYGWALGQVFGTGLYQRVIILEEDLEVADDFFRYMRAMSPLLDEDESLLCVSAWNDNGKQDLISSREQVYRTDFFPGLGWMMHRRLWDELSSIWPAGFWDDWLRQPKHRKGRACIRPEVPRTYMWCGPGGVSGGQFCRQYLSQMKLDDVPVDWDTAVDLDSLKKDQYDTWLADTIDAATEVHSPEDIRGSGRGEEYKIYYTTNREFSFLAQAFGLMPDFKDNVPRGAYKGIVSFRWRGHRVHLVSRFSLYE